MDNFNDYIKPYEINIIMQNLCGLIGFLEPDKALYFYQGNWEPEPLPKEVQESIDDLRKWTWIVINRLEEGKE